MKDIERIAVIGWASSSIANMERSADFFSWSVPSSKVNLKDYHLWVLLADELDENASEGSIWSLLTVDYVHDALLNNTDIYVIGNVTKEVRSQEGFRAPFLYWSGLTFSWDKVPSTAAAFDVDFLNELGISNYLKKRDKWDYALDTALNYGEALNGSYLTRVQTGLFHYDVVCQPLCNNRYRRSIAFALTLAAYSRESMREDWSLDKTYGRVIVLPRATNELRGSLESLLCEAFELSLTEAPPAWLESLSVPRQAEVDSRLSSAKTALAHAEENVSDISMQRTLLRKPLDILYQSGSDLEHSVLCVLESLGAVVERPAESNREDGWVSVQTSQGLLEGILEIKGVTKPHFDSYGIKQLLEWVNRGIQLRLKRYKPIFVGSSDVKIAPSERAFPFPDSWINQAKLGDVVALTTSTLFEAFRLHECGELDLDEFWISLFRNSGVLATPKAKGSPVISSE